MAAESSNGFKQKGAKRLRTRQQKNMSGDLVKEPLQEELPVAVAVGDEANATATVVADAISKDELVEEILSCIVAATTSFQEGKCQEAVETMRSCAAKNFLSDGRLVTVLRKELDHRGANAKYLTYRKALDDIVVALMREVQQKNSDAQSEPEKIKAPPYWLVYNVGDWSDKGWSFVPYFPRFSHSKCVATGRGSRATSPAECLHWREPETQKAMDTKISAISGELHVCTYPTQEFDGIYAQDLSANVPCHRPTYRKRRPLKPREIAKFDEERASFEEKKRQRLVSKKRRSPWGLSLHHPQKASSLKTKQTVSCAFLPFSSSSARVSEPPQQDPPPPTIASS